MTNAPRCRSCKAPVVWATTERGRPMILDAEPVADGEWIVDGTGTTVPVKADIPAGCWMPRYRAHWATCPQAKAWHSSRAQAEASR